MANANNNDYAVDERDVNMTTKTTILKLNARKARYESTVAFLLECRSYGLTPTFIRTSTNSNWFKSNTKKRSQYDDVSHEFRRRVLNIHISYNTELRNKLRFELKQAFATLKNNTSREDFSCFTREVALKRRSIKEKCDKNKNDKLERLKANLLRDNNMKFNSKWFVNLTETNIPLEVKWLLSLGKKFALPTVNSQIPLLKIITDVEECIKTIPENDSEGEPTNDRDIVRAQVANILSNVQDKAESMKPIQRLLLQFHHETIKFLKQNNKIVILVADKGGNTIAMPYTEYDRKMKELLNDTQKYAPLRRSPLNALEERANKLIDELCTCGEIDWIRKARMKKHNTQIARIYGFIKLHKAGHPIRPVVAAYDTPSTELAIYVINILKRLVHDKYDIHNSFEFREKTKAINVDDDEVIMCLDAKNLFPSIPIKYTIELINKQWRKLYRHTKMSKQLFMSILEFILVESPVFCYDGKFYKQTDGTGMGMNAAPIIASLVTNTIFDQVLNVFWDKHQFKPKLIAKYVDDIAIILPKHLAQTFVNELNNVLPGQIEFTSETEINGEIAYLDMLLLRQPDGCIKIDWYQKPTACNRTLNFYSEHPINQKRAVAYGMFHRVLSLVDDEFKKKSTDRIINILLENSYPIDLIKKQLRKFNSIEKTPTDSFQNTNDNTERIVRRPLSYYPSISNKIRRTFTKRNPNLNVAFKPMNKLGNTTFTKLKHKIEQEDRTNCVYKIPCSGKANEKCKKSYIGQSKNPLKIRLGQHKTSVRAFKDGNMPNPDTHKTEEQATALVLHSQTTGHYPDFKNASIVDTESFLPRRLTLESLHIYCNDTFNKRRDIQNISKSYAEVLERVKHNSR